KTATSTVAAVLLAARCSRRPKTIESPRILARAWFRRRAGSGVGSPKRPQELVRSLVRSRRGTARLESLQQGRQPLAQTLDAVRDETGRAFGAVRGRADAHRQIDRLIVHLDEQLANDGRVVGAQRAVP